MTETLTHFIAGRRVEAKAAGQSLNPSDLADVVAEVPAGGAAEVDAAVDAARRAFPDWAEGGPERRSDVLDKTGDLILQRRQALGELLSREEGKTLAEGIGEVTRAGRIFKFFAGEALRMHGQHLDSTRPHVEVDTIREPVGVFGLITPWNFPIAIPAWKSAPALAFGNTVVMKAAGPTPATAHALAGIIHEAGAPDGVFNLIIGPGRVGAAIAEHVGIDGVSFTGSQGVGAQVAAAAVAHQKRVQLEMGGKNPLVVLDDADFDRAVMCALDGAFFGTGQRCTASSRIIVTAGIYDRFVEALAARAAGLRVGHALDPASQMGPVVSESQLEQDLGAVAMAVGEGGRLVGEGGRRLTLDKEGYYMSPAVIADTTPEMRINREEVFGPVASVIKVADYEEALAIANGLDFGLSAGICTQSLKHAHDFRRRARAGMVMINLPTAGVDYHVPFGGSRGSSYGPKEQGFAAVEFFTQTKVAYTWA